MDYARERWVRILQEYYRLGLEQRSWRYAAKTLTTAGYTVSRDALQRAVKKYATDYVTIPLPSVPLTEDLPIEELISQRRSRYEHKAAAEESSKLVHIALKPQGSYGVLIFGDPHIDDDGTDLGALLDHAELVRSIENLYAINAGDTTNNWVGRLARLYAQQSTTAREAWRLAEHFTTLLTGKWIAIIAGNHDLWSGDGDPMIWIARNANALYKSSEIRLEIRAQAKRGEVSMRINARHDFEGSSQYNPAHGPMKAALFGVRDHLLICGHLHKSGYGILKDPQSGIACHAVQVGSYKIYDRYAKEKGFRDQSLGPACLVTCNVELEETHPDYVKVWWDPYEGARYLNFLRKEQQGAGQSERTAYRKDAAKAKRR